METPNEHPNSSTTDHIAKAKSSKPIAQHFKEAEETLFRLEQELAEICARTPFCGVNLSTPFFAKFYGNTQALQAFSEKTQDCHGILLQKKPNIKPHLPKETRLDYLQELGNPSENHRLEDIEKNRIEAGKPILSKIQLSFKQFYEHHQLAKEESTSKQAYLLTYYIFCIHVLYLKAEYAFYNRLGPHMVPYLSKMLVLYNEISDRISHIPASLLRYLVDYFHILRRYYWHDLQQNRNFRDKDLFFLCQDAFNVCKTVTEPAEKIALIQIAFALADSTFVIDPEATRIMETALRPEKLPVLDMNEIDRLGAQTNEENFKKPLHKDYVAVFILREALETKIDHINKMKRHEVSKKQRLLAAGVSSTLEEAERILERHLPLFVQVVFSRPLFLKEGLVSSDTMDNPDYAALCLLNMLQKLSRMLLKTYEMESQLYTKPLDEISDIVKKFIVDMDKSGLDMKALAKLQYSSYKPFVNKGERLHILFVTCTLLESMLEPHYLFNFKRLELKEQDIAHVQPINERIMRWSGAFQSLKHIEELLQSKAQQNSEELLQEDLKQQDKPVSAKKQAPQKKSKSRKAAKKEITAQEAPADKALEQPEQTIMLYTVPQLDKNTVIKLCVQNQFYQAREYLKKLYPPKAQSFEDLQKLLSLSDFWAHCQHKYDALPYHTKGAFSTCCRLQEEIMQRYPELAQKIGLSEYNDYQNMLAYYEALEEQSATPIQEPQNPRAIPLKTDTASPPTSTSRKKPQNSPKNPVLPKPEDIHLKRKKMDWTNSPSVCPEARTIFEKLEQAGLRFFIYGGWVRDMHRQAKPKDIDLLIFASADTLRACLGCAPFTQTSKHLPLGQIHLPNVEPIDVLYLPPTSSKAEVDAVLKNRYQQADLTCNALFYDWENTTLIYEQSALADVEQGLLKLPKHCDPKAHYRDDPIRMWRVLYFRLKLGFKMDEALRQSILDSHTLIEQVNEDRRFSEFKKLCSQEYLGALKLLVEFKFNTLPCLHVLTYELIAKLESIPGLSEKLRPQPDAYMAILHAKLWVEQYAQQSLDSKTFTQKFLGERGIFKRPQSQYAHLNVFSRIWQGLAYPNRADTAHESAQTLTADSHLDWVRAVNQALELDRFLSPGRTSLGFFKHQATATDMGYNPHHPFAHGV